MQAVAPSAVPANGAALLNLKDTFAKHNAPEAQQFGVNPQVERHRGLGPTLVQAAANSEVLPGTFNCSQLW